MALFKCSVCGWEKETRCRPGKCAECGAGKEAIVKVDAEKK